MHQPMANNVFLNDSGPRPLPFYLRQPPPPPQEKAVPCVPDVSLIFGEGQGLDRRTSNGPSSTSDSLSNVLRTPQVQSASPHPGDILFKSPAPDCMGLIKELYNLVQQQAVKLEKIEDQLQRLVNFKKQKFRHHVEIGIQTDDTENSENKSKEHERYNGANEVRTHKEDVPRSTHTYDISPTHTADLSKILKDLQLPISGDHSVYSVHNTSPHVDLPDFTEHNRVPLNQSEAESSPGIGPSVSEFGSSDEEVEVQPTVTYYKNVLGNVNRLLENHSTPPRIPKPRTRIGNESATTAQERANNLMIQQNVYNSIFIPNPKGNRNGITGDGRVPEPLPRTFLPLGIEESKPYQWSSESSNTNTTMYGMSSANLSFATRDYLERHGLINTTSQHQPINGRMQNRMLEPARQKQPKFL